MIRRDRKYCANCGESAFRLVVEVELVEVGIGGNYPELMDGHKLPLLVCLGCGQETRLVEFEPEPYTLKERHGAARTDHNL